MSFAEIRSNSFGSVISENNSTNFYIKLVGVHNNLSESQKEEWGIHVNNLRVSTQPRRGINIVKFADNMTVIEQVVFDLYQNPTTDGQRFIEYLKNSTNIMALYSSDAIGDTVDINNAMKALGSSVWPFWFMDLTPEQYADSINRRFAYAALIDGKSQNVITEAAGSRGAGFAALTEYSLDTSTDLGSIGMGASIIEDAIEYSGKVYNVKLYDSGSPISKYPQIQKNEYIRMRADFKRDQEAITNNVECRLQVQFYDVNNGFLEAVTIRAFPGLAWETQEIVTQITKDVRYIDIGFYHAPVELNNKGTTFVRNVVIQPSTAPPKSVKKIRFGRTAPTQMFKEGAISGQPNTVVKFTSDEQIEASELQELNSNGYWVKLLDQNTLNKGEVFPSREAVQSSLIPHLYSDMKSVEDYRGFNGKFKFRIDYELDKGTIIWEQSSNPNESSVRDLRIIQNDLKNSTKTFTGISLSNSPSTVYDCDSSSNWHYAIGTLSPWLGGIPSNNDISSNHVRFSVWKD